MSTDSNRPRENSGEIEHAWPGAVPPAAWFLHPAAGSQFGGSPWQRSHRVWNESGFQWDAPGTGRHSQAKYQGRHSVKPAIPLGAPVLTFPDTRDPATGKSRRRRVTTVALPAAAVATVAAVSIALVTGNGPRFGQATGSKLAGPRSPQTIGMYSGQQQRGVFQQIDAIADHGRTIVTTGSQTSDGQVRQQFFVSTDAGASWRLAPVAAAGGGQPPLDHAATLVAEGPRGWLAVGPQAIWTSADGLSWTLAAAHGITPGQVGVLTGTANGFLAAGAEGAWVSRNELTWTAVQPELAPGETLRTITSAASRGPDTLMAGTIDRAGATSTSTSTGMWLSTDGGSAWTRVTAPADAIVGLGSDAAGFLAVGSGREAYFSQNGADWHYAGLIDPAGGWSPTAVNGFVVTGKTTAGDIVAYTYTGTYPGAAWTPTGSLGTESTLSPVVTAGGTVVAAGSTTASGVGQQGVLMEADRSGTVRSVPLAGIPGAVVPELAVNDMAAAAGVQVAVGSANGYPAIWRRQRGGSWTLVSTSTLTSGQDGLAALTVVTRGANGWLAVGAAEPLVFTSADGVTWQSAAGNITQDLAGAPAITAAAGPAGYIIAGQASVWWSPDLTTWSQASGINDGQVLAVAADAHGFVSVGSRDGNPAVWTTNDGRYWTAVGLPVPAGASSAVLQQVAVSGSRMAALGQATTTAGAVVPFAEVSNDGGATWHQVPFAAPGPDTAFTAVVAGSNGFTAVGQYGRPGQVSPAAWISTDGTAWTQSGLTGLNGAYRITALLPAGTATTAIGSIATQQSQGAFVMTVPAPRPATRTRR
jgi:hypothetical protein